MWQKQILPIPRFQNPAYVPRGLNSLEGDYIRPLPNVHKSLTLTC